MLLICMQVSAKYAHSLFQHTVVLYGRCMRVDYSPQGNPESRSRLDTHNNDEDQSVAPAGAVAAAAGGFIMKRKNRTGR